MATCKDCLHVDVCCSYLSTAYNKCKLATPDFKLLKNIECDECQYFKARSRFVELPKALHLCDEVHFVLRDLDEIDLKEYSFTVGSSAVSDTVQFITEIGTYGFWVGESPREFAPDYDDFFHWYELGKTVFLTREAAEQALKEREANETN